MGYYRKILYLWTVLVVVSVSPASSEGGSASGDGGSLADRLFQKGVPVQVEADELNFDRERNVYSGSGNVVVTQGDVSITAGSIHMDMTTGEASAAGGVEITDGEGNTFDGESMELDMNEDTVVVMKGRLFFKEEGLRLTGEVISKVGENKYEAEKASITSCDCEGAPAWSFSASSSKVEVGGYYEGWNAFFKIKGVPVIYSPYVAIPVKTERQSGLLMPELGYSKLKGYKMDNSFFWAISENTDATLYLDIESVRGHGTGIEYRYIRSHRSAGELYYYRYRERDIDRIREMRAGEDNLGRPVSAEADRWELRYEHREDFAGGSVLTANIRLLSDDEYFLDLGGSNERPLEAIESNLAFTTGWEGYSLTAEARLFDNMLKADDSDELQMLPAVTLTGTPQRISTSPLFISSESTFINFKRNVGRDGRRLDFMPTVFVPIRPGGVMELTPSYTPRYTRYWSEGTSGDKDHERFIYEAKVDAVTTFIRFFDTESAGPIAHTIRPRLVYTYIPGVDQSELPSFDSVDSVAQANSITYSLNMTVTGSKGASGARREYLYMDISQGYDIGMDRSGAPRPSSDITGELRTSPTEWSSVALDGVFDVYDDRFENYSAALKLGKDEDTKLDLNYHYVLDSTDYFDAAAAARITETVRATYRNRYSLSDDRSIEMSYGLEYRHKCWGVDFIYTDRIDENLVLVTLSLAGVGEVVNTEYDR